MKYLLRLPVAYALVNSLAVVSCGGGGGGGGGGGTGGPSGLDLRVDGDVVNSGSTLPSIEDAPLFNNVWDSSSGDGAGVINEGSVIHLDYSVSGSTADTLDQFRFEMQGDTDAFTADVFRFPGGAGSVDVYCTPPDEGTFEVTLSAGIVERSGSHVTTLSCTGVADFALFRGVIFDTFDDANSVVLSSGDIYHHSTHELEQRNLQNSLLGGNSPEGTLSTDGTHFVIGGGGSTQIQLVDVETQTPVDILTDDDKAMYVDNFYGITTARISGDGSKVAVQAARAMFIKDLTSGAIDTVDLPTDPNNGLPGLYSGVFKFSSDGDRLLYATSQMGETFFPLENVKVFDRTQGTSEVIGAPATAEFNAVSRLTANDDMSLFVLGIANQGSFEFKLYERGSDTLQPLFEGVLDHLDTLPGSQGSIAIPDAPTLSADGKYVGVGISYWSGTDYWGGPKAAYVQEIETGKIWNVAVLPNGTPLSGDGWAVGNVRISAGGEHAVLAALWSAGVGGGLANSVGQNVVFVPRRLWTQLP